MKKTIIILCTILFSSCYKDLAVLPEGATQEIVITSNRPIDIKLGHDHWRTTGKQMTYLTTIVEGVITYIELESIEPFTGFIRIDNKTWEYASDSFNTYKKAL